jgi:hypothetical protein
MHTAKSFLLACAHRRESRGAGARKINPRGKSIEATSSVQAAAEAQALAQATSQAGPVPACDIRMQPHWRAGSCQNSSNMSSRVDAFGRLLSVDIS